MEPDAARPGGFEHPRLVGSFRQVHGYGMHPNVRGSLAAAAALAAVGSLVAAADVIADYPVAAGQTLRYALGGAILLTLLRGRLPRLARRELLLAAALATTGLVLFNVLVIGAVRHGDPGTVGVIIGCVPVVLAIVAPLLERRRPSPRLVAAGAVVAAGAAGVEQAGGGVSGTGLLLALGALGCEACFSLLAVPLLRRISPLELSAYVSLLAVPMLAGWSLVADGPALQAPTTAQVVALAYLACVVTVGGFVLWYAAIGLLGVERAGLFTGVLPLSALACAAAIGAAEITPERLAAGAVVMLGIAAGMRPTASTRRGIGLVDVAQPASPTASRMPAHSPRRRKAARHARRAELPRQAALQRTTTED